MIFPFKKKRIIFNLGVLGTLGSSIVLAACSNAEFGNEVKVALPFGEKSAQYTAFKEVADKYNEWYQKTEAKNREGYLPVKYYSSTNYGANSETLRTRLRAADYNNLPNLSLGYGNNIYDANNAGMVMDFSKPSATEANDNLDKNLFNTQLLTANTTISGVNKDGLYLLPMGVSTQAIYFNKIVMHTLLSEVLTKTNFTIKAGDENWFKDNLGVAKSSSSSAAEPVAETATETSTPPAAQAGAQTENQPGAQTETQPADQPAAQPPEQPDAKPADDTNTTTSSSQPAADEVKSVAQRQSDPTATETETSKPQTDTADTASSESKTEPKAEESKTPTNTEKQIYTPDAAKVSAVKTYYGEIKSEAFKDETNKYEVSKETFQNYTDLLNFAGVLANAFTNKKSVLSLDWANSVEMMSFLKGNADYNKFLWTRKTGDNADYDYSFFKDKNSEGAQTLKAVFDKISAAGAKNALWVSKRSNSYPSTDMAKNELGMLLGSTSAYNYMNNQLTDNDLFIVNEPYKLTKKAAATNESSTEENEAFVIQGGSLFGINFKNQKLDHATRLFVNWLFTKEAAKRGHTFEVQKGQESFQLNGFDYYAYKAGYFSGSKNFFDTKNSPLFDTPVRKMAFEALGKINADLVKTEKTKQTDTPSQPSQETTSSTTFSWGFDIPKKAVGFIEPVGKFSGTFRSITESMFQNLTDKTFPTFDQYWTTLTQNPSIEAEK